MKATVIQSIATLFESGTLAAMADGPLLERFVAGRDGLAFEAIVARHGPMVLGVCRRVLAEPTDAEDAFQATFLVLVRKAGTLRDRDRLAPWLYGVAYRVARRARAASRRSRGRSELGEREPAIEPDPAADLERREALAALDEELARLPEKYRSSIVLCDLEGLTYDEAARRLGCPLGTLKSRLASARDRLRRRLVRRGVASAVAAPAAVPPGLLRATVKAVVRPAAGVVPASVSSLIEGVLTTMFLSRIRTIAAVLLAAGTGAAGLGALARSQTYTLTRTPPPGRAQPQRTTRFDDAIRDMEGRLEALKRGREAELARIDSQDRTAARIETLGGRVERDVVAVNLVATAVTDEDLKLLGAFPGLQKVYLHHNTIGDAGLANMQGLKNLTTLDLFDTRVTDAGIEHLSEWMPSLEWLDLNGTRVSDAGLRHLRGLKHLRRLDVRKTNVTEGGVNELRRTLPDAEILR